MLENVPQSRILLFILLLGTLPIWIAASLFYIQKSDLTTIENNLQYIREQAYSYKKKQAKNIAIRINYRDADHFYIDKHLESLSFLEPEIQSLEKISTNKDYPTDENINRRLEFLKGGGNSLLFTEGVVQRHPHFQEVTETLVHPVEVNVSDLQHILSRIEGVPIGNSQPEPDRPQLLILEFKLDKKNITEKNQVFNLNMKLLKREFQ